MIIIFALFVLCIVSSWTAIRFGISYALARNITDNPDNSHKQHKSSTPFVGGIGVLTALMIVFTTLAILYPDKMHQWLALGLCSLTIFIAGFIDDTRQLSYKTRLIIQTAVAFIMVWGGTIVLNDLGGLLPNISLELGLFAIPFTVFAVVGCINALNMIDGIDGLSGSISLVSLSLISITAFAANNHQALFLTIALAGGVIGFLYFNLRYSSQPNARVFLGDNGSMLLGFLFAWLFIDLSQGTHAVIQPVTALWLFAFPLMDTISVIKRRIRHGKSPFSPDFNHLHHIFLKAGFRVEEVVYIIVLIHFSCGAIGIIGLYLGVPEYLMFLGFLMLFLGYYKLTLKPWTFIPFVRYHHTKLGLTPFADKGIFSGQYTVEEVKNNMHIISKALGSNTDFWIKAYEQRLTNDIPSKQYAITLNIRLPDTLQDNMTEEYAAQLPNILKKYNIQLRQLIARHGDDDRRKTDRRKRNNYSDSPDKRTINRRQSDRRNTSHLRRIIQRRSEDRHTNERRTQARRYADRRVADRYKFGAHVLVFEII